MKVLVTGGTGYVGGRLVPRLLESGHQVRVLSRNPRRVQGRPWAGRVETARGDVSDPEALAEAIRGIDAAYYLVHSMCSGDDFAERDREAAQTWVEVTRGNLQRTIYLGGLTPTLQEGDVASDHLSSRAEVGQILREGVPTVEIQAGPIIGSGSASFEMVRYLTERLPAMVAPRWILNDVQPIGVRNVLEYLVLALDRPGAEGVVEVGGADVLSFREMMHVYASVRGLSRVIVPLPVLAPRLAALWVGLVTPIPNCLAVPLVEGVVRPVVADTSRARELFPEVDPMPYRRAVELSVTRVEEGDVLTRWSGAVSEPSTYEFEDREGVVREIRTRHVDATPDEVFAAFTSLGGETGWLVWEWAWGLRGLLDQLVGGPGLRRGRRHPSEVQIGEAVDFWRVEEVQRPEVLRLRAEMKVPGRAWLQWETRPEDGGTRLIQTAFFAPTGLPGALYWYGIYPVHGYIFSDLVDAVAKRAESLDRDQGEGVEAGPAPASRPAPEAGE